MHYGRKSQFQESISVAISSRLMLQQYNHERTPWSLVEKSVQSMLYINRVAKTISENSSCVIILLLTEVLISNICYIAYMQFSITAYIIHGSMYTYVEISNWLQGNGIFLGFCSLQRVVLGAYMLQPCTYVLPPLGINMHPPKKIKNQIGVLMCSDRAMLFLYLT